MSTQISKFRAQAGIVKSSSQVSSIVLEQEVQCSPQEKSSHEASKVFHTSSPCTQFYLKYKRTAKLDKGKRFLGCYLRFYE